jgi:hypothetical protein
VRKRVDCAEFCNFRTGVPWVSLQAMWCRSLRRVPRCPTWRNR